MSLTESLPEKLLRLRQTAEAVESSGPLVKKQQLRAKSSTESTALSSAGETVDQDFQSLLKGYKDAIEKCEREKEDKQNDFLAFKGKVDDLRAAYLFGLKQVSGLKDLQDAPDAILFGNFPQETKSIKSKTNDENAS